MARSARSEPLRFDFDSFDGPIAAPAPGGASAVVDVSSAGTPTTTSTETVLDAPGEPAGEVAVDRADRASETATPAAGDPGSRSSDRALTVAELYDRLRAAVARAFPSELWVVGEIRSHRERKGHHYLEIADPGQRGARAGQSGQGGQQIEIVCWARDWQRISRELEGAGVSLEEGRVVRVRGRAGVWEGGGKLRLTVSTVDVEALVGAIAVARQKLLAALAAEDLLEANHRRPLSLVPLRIGLVTSEGSEAHRDFAGRLARSPYAFDVHLEPSLVQGPQAPWQIAAALRRLERYRPDLAVVVRGGGGRGDLACFDGEQVARAIAAAPFPVWIGVGHTGDRSVADEVAHGSFVTPTACGDALVARVDVYWGGISRAATRIAGRAATALTSADERLVRERRSLGRGVMHQLDRRADELAGRSERAAAAAQRRLAACAEEVASAAVTLARCGREGASEPARQLRRCRDVLRAYDPQRQLERGWSLTHDEAGRLVRSVAGLGPGSVVRTRVADGQLEALVRSTSPGMPASGEGEP